MSALKVVSEKSHQLLSISHGCWIILALNCFMFQLLQTLRNLPFLTVGLDLAQVEVSVISQVLLEYTMLASVDVMDRGAGVTIAHVNIVDQL